MKKRCMVIDIEKCENCNNCFLACKDEHYGNDWQGYTLSQPLHGHRWMNILKKEHGTFPHIKVAYMPKPCFHCEDAPCVSATSDGSVYKREDGIVIIDHKKAKGNKEIQKSCPHGAIWWNSDRQVAQKCTLCAHLLDEGWKMPRCVQACPTGALTFHTVEEEELDSFITSNRLQPFVHTVTRGSSSGSSESLPAAEKVTHNIVLYKNIHLYNCCFIAGSVATGKGETEECVPDAIVELYYNDTLIRQIQTDMFGDYCFDGLGENSGLYQIKITYNQKAFQTIEATLGKSCFVGVTWI